MTTRRQFLFAGALGALVFRRVGAQSRQPRIGMLSPHSKSVLAPLVLQGLSELGYRDGAGMLLEFRSADGVDDRHAKLARELINSKCDVIFAVGDSAARAFRDARTPVPVVFLTVDNDPVEKGIVASLRRPGGNMTGVYTLTAGMTGKRLEIAQEALPGSSHFLVLSDIYTKDQLLAMKQAAGARRVQLTIVEFSQQPYDFVAALETGRLAGAHAIVALNSVVFAGSRAALSAAIVTSRLPAFVPTFMAAEPGNLVSYGIDPAKLAQRAAELGVKILKGAKPADIPVEQADEFELVVNLKTAKALGVKIPYSVMARATRVIE